MKNQLPTTLSLFIVVATCSGQATQRPPLSDRSIYQVESFWTNDLGQTVRLANLRGKPQVLTMFFTQCQAACPLLVQEMRQIESALPANVRSRVGFTLISFDTEHDTPEVLAEYRKKHSLPTGRWTLLHGKDDDVLELAALLGVKFKKDARGQFAHSNVITLLSAEGEIVRQQTGLGQDHKQLVNAIKQISD